MICHPIILWTFFVLITSFIFRLLYIIICIHIFICLKLNTYRFVVICHPMKAASRSTPGRARKVIVLTWVLALVLAAPGAFTSVLIHCIDDYELSHYFQHINTVSGVLFKIINVSFYHIK